MGRSAHCLTQWGKRGQGSSNQQWEGKCTQVTQKVGMVVMGKVVMEAKREGE